jgi:hypothetical protein
VKVDPGVIAGVCTVLAALLAIVGIVIGQMWARLSALEERVEKSAAYNRRLWEWARKHIDLYYRYRRDGSPEPDPIPEDD